MLEILTINPQLKLFGGRMLKGCNCEFTLKNPTTLPRLRGTIRSIDVPRNRAWVTTSGNDTFCVPLRCIRPFRAKQPMRKTDTQSQL